jgi:hypothetical protein
MKIRFQADNDFNGRVVRAVARLSPAVDFQTAAAIGLHGLPDERVLELAAAEGRILVSHDRKTMPIHFRNFIARQESPGLFIVSQNLPIAEAAEWLYTFWAASEAAEHVNLITYIP